MGHTLQKATIFAKASVNKTAVMDNGANNKAILIDAHFSTLMLVMISLEPRIISSPTIKINSTLKKTKTKKN